MKVEQMGSHSTYLQGELDGLIASYPDRIQVYYVLKQAPEGWNGGLGFISEEMIQTHCPAPADDIQIWMCGSPPMIKTTVANLVALGYSEPMWFQF
ncbi:hypothetical protein RHSIM_Rhsim08G0072100 [Rhododendron simsii]|uniref:Oxidoreductase FAD/NAD(P)-binding domain-containing protein n=1 Tax=Rhododendron simsii TaxID=118357 RepID=A0A834LGK2_RHOSS|nr:hypothetical protein RHSIM_Rhsim08G0072100 [Rhododendron simsii]